METRILFICLAIGFLDLVGIVYGTRFLKVRNHMLGYEWYILSISASCAILYFMGISDTAGYVSDFLDKFSKLWGIAVIASIGMLKAVHGLSMHPAKEFGMFVLGLLLTAVIMFEPTLQATIPHLTAFTSTFFTGTLIYLAWICFRRGLNAYGWGVIINIVVNVPITIIQDFVVLPTETTSNYLNKFFLENVVWAVSFAFLYYLYRALANSEERYADVGTAVRAPT